MNEAKEKTALCTSVGADERQSVQNTISSISALDTEINHPDENSPENFEDIMRQMQRMSDPAYLHTVSMNELYETVYQSRPPVIDGLLCSGTYLFAGAPKVGKSFFMAQLAYHISTGQPLWNYEVHQGTVLYLALEDDYQRLQERMSRMFGVEGTDNLHFAVYAKQLGAGLDEQLEKFIREHHDTRLIIIDTLQKIREVSTDAYSYANDYDIEATPHLHIDFIPFTTGSKRGLSTRVSLKQALADQGITGEGRSLTERDLWVQKEKEALAEIMLEHGIEWEQKGEHKEHLSVLEFKREKRKEELAELEQSIERVQQQQVSIQAVEQIEVKPLPLTSKVAVDREDYQNLVTAAQKYVVQEKQEGKLKKLLKEAKKTISDLKAKIQSLTAELSAVKAELAQYKSVRGKLRTADLEQENSRLRSKIRSYESAIERNDLWYIFNPHRNKTHNRDDAR